MIQRCYNTKNKRYFRYGGRGITVCERWRESFEAFLADMGPAEKGLSVDRINNDGNYEPGNCRWATAKDQARNRANNKKKLYKGEMMFLKDICLLAGVSMNSVASRMRKGVALETAIRKAPKIKRGERAGVSCAS